MSDKTKFPWEIARPVADELIEMLAPFCLPDRIIAAGSLRRLRRLVSDVEIVYCPRKETRPKKGDMFAVEEIDLADEQLFREINAGRLSMRPNVKGQTTWGEQIKLARHTSTGIPIDFFPICEASWENYKVCRTGPKESNVAICVAAEKRGYQWKPYSAGFMDVNTMEIVPMRSERDVFEFVGLKYLEPKDRM
jgi:DNA polymerase/3'-5' exonuclease PolX